MKTKAEVKAMLSKVESTQGVVDGRQELIMALEWVLGDGASTSMALEDVMEEDEEEEEDDVEVTA